MDNGGHIAGARFSDPLVTAKGERRAHVAFTGFKTLWVNTGTLCNIECVGCYIESTPKNDALVYFTPEDFAPFLAELADMDAGRIEIGFTGGEPMMNPHIITLLDMALDAGHTALVLTNGMAPMMRPRVQAGLLDLKDRFGDRLMLRVSFDHYSAEKHDEVRGKSAFAQAIIGTNWLSAQGFAIAIAGRTMWQEAKEDAQKGYIDLIEAQNWAVDVKNPRQFVLFPEMEANSNPPEISVACWDILGVKPESQMCASARMLVKAKGATKAHVTACTLLAYDGRFALGPRLSGALAPVALNHPHCATFCVLGGGSCSV